MKKNEPHSLFFLILRQILVSAAAVAVILPSVLAAVKACLALLRLIFGPELAYRMKMSAGDAAAFALICAMTALSQYYLTSQLSYSRPGKKELAAATISCALACGWFFKYAAGFSSLGAYALCGLPVVLATLIGGSAAICQKPAENPWTQSHAPFLFFKMFLL